MRQVTRLELDRDLAHTYCLTNSHIRGDGVNQSATADTRPITEPTLEQSLSGVIDAAHLPVPGDLIDGKLLIERILGEGGMGRVYQAMNVFMECRFAVKFATSARAMARFRNELKLSARIQHPGLVQVCDAGQNYLVTELLRGETLRERMRKGPIRYRELLVRLLPVMEGLATLHRNGILHRDVTPNNIMLCVNGRGKLFDFGIAKSLDVRDDQTNTQTGCEIGTPDYIAPERLSDTRTIDGRSDMYSIAMVIYRALTGVRSGPVTTTELRRVAPHTLTQIILRALSRDPEQRLPNMDAFIRALAPFSRGPTLRDATVSTVVFASLVSASLASGAPYLWPLIRGAFGAAPTPPAAAEERSPQPSAALDTTPQIAPDGARHEQKHKRKAPAASGDVVVVVVAHDSSDRPRNGPSTAGGSSAGGFAVGAAGAPATVFDVPGTEPETREPSLLIPPVSTGNPVATTGEARDSELTLTGATACASLVATAVPTYESTSIEASGERALRVARDDDSAHVKVSLRSTSANGKISVADVETDSDAYEVVDLPKDTELDEEGSLVFEIRANKRAKEPGLLRWTAIIEVDGAQCVTTQSIPLMTQD